MYWYWHNYLAVVSAPPASRSYPSLDTFPLCSPVLEPDLDLNLRQPQVVGYLGSLGEAEILLAVKFLK